MTQTILNFNIETKNHPIFDMVNSLTILSFKSLYLIYL